MAETAAKPTSPVRNVTFRPSRSDSLPPSSSKLPNDSVYAVTTHCRSTVEKCSARCADGNAIFITVRSSTTISCARPITHSSTQRRRSGPPPVTVASAMTITLRLLLTRLTRIPRRRLTPRSPLQSCDQADERSSPDPGDSPACPRDPGPVDQMGLMVLTVETAFGSRTGAPVTKASPGDSRSGVSFLSSSRSRPSASISASTPYSADRSSRPVSTVCRPWCCGASAGNADSMVAPRCPLIRIMYGAGAGFMRPWSRAGR